MTLLEKMLRSRPAGDFPFSEDYAALLTLLERCATVCVTCADACLGEKEIAPLRRCIRLDLDCANVCTTTARVLVRQREASADLTHALLHTCSLACQLCADECGSHAEMHEHCRICSESCRECQEHCNRLLGETSSSGVAATATRPEDTASS
jgi:hypothetical protein